MSLPNRKQHSEASTACCPCKQNVFSWFRAFSFTVTERSRTTLYLQNMRRKSAFHTAQRTTLCGFQIWVTSLELLLFQIVGNNTTTWIRYSHFRTSHIFLSSRNQIFVKCSPSLYVHGFCGTPSQTAHYHTPTSLFFAGCFQLEVPQVRSCVSHPALRSAKPPAYL